MPITCHMSLRITRSFHMRIKLCSYIELVQKKIVIDLNFIQWNVMISVVISTMRHIRNYFAFRKNQPFALTIKEKEEKKQR